MFVGWQMRRGWPPPILPAMRLLIDSSVQRIRKGYDRRCKFAARLKSKIMPCLSRLRKLARLLKSEL